MSNRTRRARRHEQPIDSRRQEITAILAEGLSRIHAAINIPPAESQNLEQNSLEVSAKQRLIVPNG